MVQNWWSTWLNHNRSYEIDKMKISPFAEFNTYEHFNGLEHIILSKTVIDPVLENLIVYAEFRL